MISRRTFLKGAAVTPIGGLFLSDSTIYMHCSECGKPVLKYVGPSGTLTLVKKHLGRNVPRSSDWQSLDDPTQPAPGSTIKPCHHCGEPMNMTLRKIR